MIAVQVSMGHSLHTSTAYGRGRLQAPLRAPPQHGRPLRCPRASEADAAVKQAWYEKRTELWRELHSEEEWAAALAAASSAEQLLVVDYYAPWCSVCKASYPAICRTVEDGALRKSFLFAKASIEHAVNKAQIKREGVTGIPYIGVYRHDGSKVAGFSGSFRKAAIVRTNLELVACSKDRLPTAAWPVDPNGHLVSLEQMERMTGAGGSGNGQQ